jgi:hypothetical protein
VAFPFMFIFVWNYLRLFWKFIGTCIFVSHRNRKKMDELRAIRKSIFERLDAMLK